MPESAPGVRVLRFGDVKIGNRFARLNRTTNESDYGTVGRIHYDSDWRISAIFDQTGNEVYCGSGDMSLSLLTDANQSIAATIVTVDNGLSLVS